MAKISCCFLIANTSCTVSWLIIYFIERPHWKVCKSLWVLIVLPLQCLRATRFFSSYQKVQVTSDIYLNISHCSFISASCYDAKSVNKVRFAKNCHTVKTYFCWFTWWYNVVILATSTQTTNLHVTMLLSEPLLVHIYIHIKIN